MVSHYLREVSFNQLGRILKESYQMQLHILVFNWLNAHSRQVLPSRLDILCNNWIGIEFSSNIWKSHQLIDTENKID